MPFYIKQNDTSPSLSATLRAPGLSLAGATVRFHMRDKFKSLKVDAAATIVSATANTVRYDWDDGDTDTAGTFQAEFEVTLADGKVERFPNADFIDVVITESIA